MSPKQGSRKPLGPLKLPLGVPKHFWEDFIICYFKFILHKPLNNSLNSEQLFIKKGISRLITKQNFTSNIFLIKMLRKTHLRFNRILWTFLKFLRVPRFEKLWETLSLNIYLEVSKA